MATKTTTTKRTTGTTTAKVRTISEGDVTVNVGKTAVTSETVSVLFRSRRSQTFFLKNGRSVTINGNAVYLAGVNGGALPAGGYGVTTIDKADWEEIMETYGDVYRGWFDSGKLKAEKTETKAVDFAQSHAEDDAGDNPVAVAQ